MIKFSGLISGKTEKFFWKKYSSDQRILWSLSSISIFAPSILSYRTFGNKMLLLMIPVGIMGLLLSLFLPRIIKSKERKKLIPYTISIDEKKITLLSEGHSESAGLDDIHYIKDYGSFYYFVFKNKHGTFIAQKDLISEGTIEEFELRFENKLNGLKKYL